MSLAEASNCMPVALSTVILPRERSRSPPHLDQSIRCTLVLVIPALFFFLAFVFFRVHFARDFRKHVCSADSLMCLRLFLIVIWNMRTYLHLSYYAVCCSFSTGKSWKVFCSSSLPSGKMLHSSLSFLRRCTRCRVCESRCILESKHFADGRVVNRRLASHEIKLK